MPAATGSLEACEEAYSTLEKEVDFVLEQFIAAADSGPDFYRAMERVEEQTALARKLLATKTDLELNETTVIAEKIDGELALAERLACGAALAEAQEEWAGEFECAKNSLDSMRLQLRKMKSASGEGETLEARSALLSFRREAASCRGRLSRLKGVLSSRKHSAYSQVRAARQKVRRLKSEAGKAFDRIARARLRRKIAVAKTEISHFVRQFQTARLFVDHKHLTLAGGGKTERMPLTQAVRFALEEIAPVQESLAKLGRNGTVLLGTYERDGYGELLRIGERSVAGDTIIYREKTYRLDA